MRKTLVIVIFSALVILSSWGVKALDRTTVRKEIQDGENVVLITNESKPLVIPDASQEVIQRADEAIERLGRLEEYVNQLETRIVKLEEGTR